MKLLVLVTCLYLAASSKAQDSISFLKSSQLTGSFQSHSVAGGMQLDNGEYVVLYDLYYGLSSHQGLLVRYDKFGNLITGSEKTTISQSRFVDLGYGKFAVYSDGIPHQFAIYDEGINQLWKNDTKPFKRVFCSINDSIGYGTINDYDKKKYKIASFNLNSGFLRWSKSYGELLMVDSIKANKYHVISINSIGTDANVFFVSSVSDSSVLIRLDKNGVILNYSSFNTEVSNVVSSHVNGNDYNWLISRNAFHTPPPIPMTIRVLKNKIEVANFSVNDLIGKKEFNYTEASFRSDGNFQLVIYEAGDTNASNYIRVMIFSPDGNLLKEVRYSTNNKSIDVNSTNFIKEDFGYFFTGTTGYLAPENRSFIMKTDTNGFVQNPTLFPLKVDTGLSISVSEFLKLGSDYSVYPNPTKDHFVVRFTGDHRVELIILDVQGKIVGKLNVFSEEVISTDKLDAGIYFLQIKNVGEVETFKIIKQ